MNLGGAGEHDPNSYRRWLDRQRTSEPDPLVDAVEDAPMTRARIKLAMICPKHGTEWICLAELTNAVDLGGRVSWRLYPLNHEHLFCTSCLAEAIPHDALEPR